MWENIPCKTTVVIALDLPDSDFVSNHKTNILCFAPGAAIMRVIYLAVAFGLIGVLVAKATKDQNNKFDDVWRERMEETMAKMTKTIDQLGRQVKLQQLFVEERIRSDGSSGIKQTRLVQQGKQSYGPEH